MKFLNVCWQVWVEDGWKFAFGGFVGALAMDLYYSIRIYFQQWRRTRTRKRHILPPSQTAK